MPRERRPDILYVVHRVPYPPDKGDRIRAFHVLKHLSGHANVHLACLADEPLEPSVLRSLEEYCERVAIVPLSGWRRWARALGSLAWGGTCTEGAFDSPALRVTIRRWAAETRFHAAVASASSVVRYLRLAELRSVPAVVDLVDVDSQKWLDYAAASRGPRAWLYRLEGRRLRRLEKTLPGWARAVTLVSEAEADLYRSFCDEGQVLAITNGVDVDYFRPQAVETEQACVFVGALDYRPNVEGVCWFCRAVWPAVRRNYPHAKLYLVGRRPAPAVCQLSDVPGVEVVGQVPDVRPYVARAAIAVVPLQIARGVQNKVLEAMAMGKATIASPQALQGLRATPGLDVLAASTPEQWHHAISHLMDGTAAREKLGQAARRYVEEHHCWDRCLEPLGQLVQMPPHHPVAKSTCSPLHGTSPVLAATGKTSH